MRILMVCLGNICRSPLAEGVLKQKVKEAGLGWQVDSAGTNRYHTGQAPHHLSQKVAKLNGIDICDQRARTFTPADMDAYDQIYVLAGDVYDEVRRIAGRSFQPAKIAYLMDELHPGRQMEVPDPYYGEEPGFHDVYKLIDEACDAIVAKYK